MSSLHKTCIFKGDVRETTSKGDFRKFPALLKESLRRMTPGKGLSFFFFVVLPFVSLPALAQNAYSLINYNEELLPQSTVGNIQQDAHGYLWMSTQFGIVRFDGEHARVFNMDNLNGLQSNRIRLCAKGWDNTIYFVDEKNVILKVISPNEFEIFATTDAIDASMLPLYARESSNDFGYLKINKKTGFEKLAASLMFDLSREFLKSFVTGKSQGYLFYMDTLQKVRLCYYNGENYASVIKSDSFKVQHTFKLNNYIFYQTNTKGATMLVDDKQSGKIPIDGLPTLFEDLLDQGLQVLFSNESGAFFYASGKLYQYTLDNHSISATLLFENLPCKGVTNVMRERVTGDYMISTSSSGFFRIKTKKIHCYR